ncbi:hypothetical protein AUR64_18365 [Haloprofundus marisrubri]|uniref:Uncharacterized protein n=1 Tax=Haloprofundus marisrubri TaxID=1514971 RepID=A0A0W1R5E4_9EURY|nr:hypothetical protein [Haloprofundus marisrubri]KTG08630.1 hypothetical protein AUR64_18365 [Haloprofundus marisrubri]
MSDVPRTDEEAASAETPETTEKTESTAAEATDENNSDSTFGRTWRLLLLAMLGFVFATTVLQFQVEGVSALPEIFVSLYVVTVVGYGVVTDSMDTRRFRIALYAGAVAWGGVRLANGDTSLVTYALLGFGAFLLTRELTFTDT